MRILYVEDNPANLFLVKRVAKIGGHEVLNYIDGEDALNNFPKDLPDLVLMDIQLAGELSGLQVVQKLRDRGYKTPIIAVTAYAMIGDRERFLAAGCDDYLAKPLPIPRLVELIDHYNKRLEADRPASNTSRDALPNRTTSTATVVMVNVNKPADKPSEGMGNADLKTEPKMPVVRRDELPHFDASPTRQVPTPEGNNPLLVDDAPTRQIPKFDALLAPRLEDLPTNLAPSAAVQIEMLDTTEVPKQPNATEGLDAADAAPDTDQ